MTASPKRVVVGLSGGVDSSVSALLLKRAGYDVIGLFMKNWDEAGHCPAEQDYKDVVAVCEKIGIPYYTLEFIEEYRDQVFREFLEDYRAGLTPNPDILCNQKIKFDIFYKKAMELGADALATGHYAQLERDSSGSPALIRAEDPGKDQSYFLFRAPYETFNKVMFPIGHLKKSQVREIALQAGLPVAQKKDSTGICFIGERNFRQFLSGYLPLNPGPMKRLNGEEVGQHQGLCFYTLGQRKGLGLGGEGAPWFVISKDLECNTLYVERGENHPALFSRKLWADRIHWLAPTIYEDFPLHCTAKVRYRQQDQECHVTRDPDGRWRVEFPEPQRSVTPGQSVVFYQDRRCLGGGRIIEVGPSLFEEGLREGGAENRSRISGERWC
jgi:tRNA-specific 2-thiouridylase